jgi:hypothetical protein
MRGLSCLVGKTAQPASKIKTGQLVLCEWMDSHGCSPTWQTAEPDIEPRLMTCKSVGWMLRKSRQCIVIVPHLSTNTDIAEQQGCGDMTIPTTAIIRLARLG